MIWLYVATKGSTTSYNLVIVLKNLLKISMNLKILNLHFYKFYILTVISRFCCHM